MKRFIRFAILLAAGLPVTASPAENAGSLTAVRLHEEWAWPESPADLSLSATCDEKKTAWRHGVKCVRFRSAAKLWGISWQSSVKTEKHDVLLSLVRTGSAPASGDTVLLPVRHFSAGNATMHSRDIRLSLPMLIFPGDRLWISVQGTGDRFYEADRRYRPEAPVEVQAIIWVEADAGPVPVQ